MVFSVNVFKNKKRWQNKKNVKNVKKRALNKKNVKKRFYIYGVKARKNFRNRSRDSPLGGHSLLKSGNV